MKNFGQCTINEILRFCVHVSTEAKYLSMFGFSISEVIPHYCMLSTPQH